MKQSILPTIGATIKVPVLTEDGQRRETVDVVNQTVEGDIIVATQDRRRFFLVEAAYLDEETGQWK